MIALDSSVVVAAFASWSEQHQAAVEILDGEVRLVAHAALESYSVLTRLPPPHRSAPGLVHDYLDRQFERPWLTFSATRHRRFLAWCAERQISGGAVYDALIAATAAAHDLPLASCDRRAAATYEALDLEVIRVGWTPDSGAGSA